MSINQNLNFFAGIDYIHSVDWIIENTNTGKIHKENSTVLCWIHSHVNKKHSYLSSDDLHYQYILQRIFPHIQAQVVDISGSKFLTQEFYILTNHGKQQLSECMKNPHSFKSSCIRNDFYQTAKYNFYDFPSMQVVDLNTAMECHELLTLDEADDFPKIIYPRDMIEEFVKVAISEVYSSGKIECLAYVAGYKDKNNLIGTHLIFPRQLGTSWKVEDLGNYSILK